MPKPTIRIARVIFLAVALLVPAATASAASTATSSNWAGYVITPKTSRTTYKTVSGSWVVPQGACTADTVGYSATWVGIGGYKSSSKALEQLGTEYDCVQGGTAKYTAWYELVPAAAHNVKMTVRPGDTIDAAVTVNGKHVTLFLRNATRNTTFRRTLTMSAPDTSSAEWIMEAPADCNSAGQCVQLPINNFGTLSFARASATTARGTTASIASPGWNNTKVTLSQGGGRGGFARFAPTRGADPSDLSADGASFSVTYSEQAPPSNQTPPMFAPGAGPSQAVSQ
jgi:hypothetical protein